ncbi:MAG: chemotaxis protein CheW, partial [Candidatus Electrothrix sp. ATG2]|nr:chemotaxis protein CheW [Candidatus Electrothrix sp. ATG2]
MLVQSDWQQSAALHKGQITPVLDFKELLAKQPDELCPQVSLPHLRSDRRFEAAFGSQQVEIVEFPLCQMTHALPDIEVMDTIPFTHCQLLPGTKGLIAGITLYRDELLPILDPARCFGRQSRPDPDWKLLLVCNDALRVLVLVEHVLGKRTLSISEQRTLPFTVSHPSVYGCYPVASRVGLIFNIRALTVYFDAKQAGGLFLIPEDLLPTLNDIDKYKEPTSALWIANKKVPDKEIAEHETSLTQEELPDQKETEQRGQREPSFVPDEQLRSSPQEPDRQDHVDNQEVKKDTPALLTEEQHSLVQSVVASMLSRKKGEIASTEEKGHQDDDLVSGSPGSLVSSERAKDSNEATKLGKEPDNKDDRNDIFPAVIAAMLSQRKNNLDDAVGTVSQDKKKPADVPQQAPGSGESEPLIPDEISPKEEEYPTEANPEDITERK